MLPSPGPCLMVLLALLVGGGTAAPAAPITYAYHGTIQAAGAAQSFQAGDSFSGTVTFDPAAPSEKADTIGNYPFGGFQTTTYTFGSGSADPTQAGMSLEVAGQPIFSALGPLIVVSSHSRYETQGGLLLQSHYGFSPDFSGDRFDRMSFQLTLENATNPAPGSADALLTGLTLADFPSATLIAFDVKSDFQMAIGYHSPYDRSFTGTLDRFEVVPTPEPTTVALWACVVLGGLVHRSRRRPAGTVSPS